MSSGPQRCCRYCGELKTRLMCPHCYHVDTHWPDCFQCGEFGTHTCMYGILCTHCARGRSDQSVISQLINDPLIINRLKIITGDLSDEQLIDTTGIRSIMLVGNG